MVLQLLKVTSFKNAGVWFVMSLVIVFLSLGCQTNKKSNGETEKASNDSKGTNWNANMMQLQEVLAKLEPYLVDEKKFNAQENEDLLRKDLTKLVESSKNVTHNPTLVSRDPTVRFVASQFTQDIQRSSESFEQGKKEFSRYQLLKVTGYCIECHTRTQQGPQYSGPAQNKNLVSLNRFQKAEYLISIRYFDDALKLLEEEVDSTDGSVGFARMERAAKYGLMITVQFQQKPDKALEFVKRIERSKHSPFALKEKARTWIKSIQAWKSEKSVRGGAEEFERLKKLAAKRSSEVDQMRALAGLLPWLSIELKPDQQGEILFLVGTCYEALSDLSLFSLHENYYESCIRSVPRSPWARKCYDRLEESIRFGYSGSGGTHIPVEVMMYLEGLKKELEP